MAKLICRECQVAKVVCPRKFNNILRAVGEKLGESEDVVRSKHTRFMAKGKQKCDEVSKAKPKESEASREARKAKGKGREKEQLPKIVIPGGHGSKSNETRSECSNSQAPCEDKKMAGDEDELDESEMDVDAPGKSKPQSWRSHSPVPQVPVDAPSGSPPQPRCPDSQVPKANEAVHASKIAVDVPETSKLQPRHSHSQVPQVSHAKDTQLANEAHNSLVDSLASLMLQPSHFPSPKLDTSFELKHKIWDELSRAELYKHLEAYETRQDIMRQLLDDATSAKNVLANHVVTFSDALEECQMRVKALENGDLLATLKREWADTRNLLKEAQSEVQQAVNQRLETESDLSKLRRKMKELEEERDEALCKAQGILQELRAAQSEVPQNLEAESELSELRRKVKALAEERDDALKEGQRLKDLLVLAEERDDALKEGQRLKDLLEKAQGPKQFGLGALLDLSPAQDQDRYRHSSPSTRDDNSLNIALLSNSVSTGLRMFTQEKNRRLELESEVACLRSELGAFSFLCW